MLTNERHMELTPICGQDISTLNTSSLREKLSLVRQKTNLFHGTIRSNIKLMAKNSEELSDEIIWELAKKLKVSEFIERLGSLSLALREIDNSSFSNFISGLDFNVGENGSKLSGGEQQKIAILRALIKKSPIRLFDEVTASLDSNNTSSILTGIKMLTQKDTVLLITHKLNEVVDADKIIVVSQGMVISEGTHKELLDSATGCQIYQSLWKKQHSLQGGFTMFSERKMDADEFDITAKVRRKSI